MPCKDAIVEALNLAFPTVVTSGSILAAAGTLISFFTSNEAIAGIGECLGRGTLVSMLLVMGVLPQILILGDTIIEKTSFELKHNLPARPVSGNIQVNGHVRGYVNGVVDADIYGTVRGTLLGKMDDGTLQALEAEL